MFVNKYKIVNSELTDTTGYTINIGVTQNSGFVGQQEIIDTKFVEVEVDKAVNIIYDYEKVKLLPKYQNTLSSKILYNLTFLNKLPAVGYKTTGAWKDLEFTSNDIKFRKKAFSESFLRLDFYDSDIATYQNLISFVTLYPKFSRNTLSGVRSVTENDSVNFQLGNTMINRLENGEGFSLYHFKDEIFPSPLPPKYLYMKATFNNAKSGKSTGLMSSSVYNLGIDDLMRTTRDIIPVNSIKNNLYTRYILNREQDGYYYEIDTDYSTNVVIPTGTNDYVVNLYEISTK